MMMIYGSAENPSEMPSGASSGRYLSDVNQVKSVLPGTHIHPDPISSECLRFLDAEEPGRNVVLYFYNVSKEKCLYD